MHTAIVKNFKKYHIFGFTGTPIFAVNAGSGKHADLRTTPQAFGEKLHTYTIVDAINDGNVLPFRIDYIKTIKDSGQAKDKQVSAIDTEKALLNQSRISEIVSYTLEHFDQKTKRNAGDSFAFSVLTNVAEVATAKNRNAIEEKKNKIRMKGFNSIFAVSSIEAAKLYYAEFKRQMEALPEAKRLRIAIIKRIIQVNQAPIGKTPRSTVVSYLEIFDEIRTLFSKTSVAKKKKLSPSMFSMNVKGGRCECCQGTGLQKIELNYLPNTYITCPECNGQRYNDDILSVTYQGKTILDVLETPISEIIEAFKESKKVYSVLDSMIKLGLGYLTLGQMSMNLSGGEAQRIKLAKALGVLSGGNNLYMLDEPTSGLNEIDVKKFVNVLFSLQAKGETILIIEHNLEFIVEIADYIVDFGNYGGNMGGKIVAQGNPKEVFSKKESSLYQLDK